MTTSLPAGAWLTSLAKRTGVVVDADAAQLLARRVHPIDHRAAPVKVDADVLSVHRGLPSWGVALRGPSVHRPGSLEERRPRSFIASPIRWSASRLFAYQGQENPCGGPP